MLRPAPPACFVPPFDPMFGVSLTPGMASASAVSGDLTPPHGQWGTPPATADAVAAALSGSANRHSNLSAAGPTGGSATEALSGDEEDADQAARDRATQASAAAAALLRHQSGLAPRNAPACAAKRAIDFDFPARHSRPRQYEERLGAPLRHDGFLPTFDPQREPPPTDGNFLGRSAEPCFMRANSLPRLDDPWCSVSDACWDTSGPTGFASAFDVCGGAAEAEALAIAGFCVGASA
jgi:hypothetical protein